MEMRPEAYRGLKTLILGEVNTGKTALTARILDAFLETEETNICVMDMAPDPVKGIGGKMRIPETHRVRYYTTDIRAPRLTGKTSREVRGLAEINARRMEALFREYLKRPGSVLFVNDVSLYLQAGHIKNLLDILEATPTAIMNGYYGTALGGEELGERERENMGRLQKRCDRIIRT